MKGFPILTILTLTPLVGGLVVAFVKNGRTARTVALFFQALALLLASLAWIGFDPEGTGMQWVERHSWIPALGVDYHLGIDGLGLLMVLLSAFVVPFGTLASGRIQDKPHAYFSLMLFLQAGLFGAFTTLNFFHWFIFWELSLVPAYFLIKLWGGPGAVAAATQFFVYTMVGSVAILLGFVALYLATGSFDFIQLAEMSATAPSGGLAALGWPGFPDGVSTRTLSLFVFFCIFLGFAVKVPLFPFHTWQPAAYTEAPTGVTMVLAGVLSKMGVYGFLRILVPIFPDQMRWVLTPLLWLAVATVVFSALAAWAQKDLKRMIAYSSMNHLGYCLLGIFAAVRLTGPETQWSTEKAAALNGVLLQMFNHGIVASAVFCFIGLIEQRAGRRGLDDFGGLRRVAPVFCGLMGIALFALLGLPGLNGFVGEFLIFKGVFALTQWAATFSVIGLLVTAIFLLTILQKVFSGPLSSSWNGFLDLTMRERCVVVPSLVVMLVLGVCPQLVLSFINPTVRQWVERLAF